MAYEQVPEALEAVLNDKEQMVTHGLGRAIRHLQNELALHRRFTEARAETTAFCSGRQFEGVQIGSGPHPIDGFVNLDLSFNADITWDIREGLPFDDNSVGFLFSEHVVEHIDYPVSVKNHFRDLHRVLRSGGVAVVGVPDGGLAAEAYVKGDAGYLDELKSRWYKNRNCLDSFNTPIDTLNYVFRDQDDDDTYTPHMWGYDRLRVCSLFEEAGFAPDSITDWEFDAKIATPKRQWGTVYIEATKG